MITYRNYNVLEMVIENFIFENIFVETNLDFCQIDDTFYVKGVYYQQQDNIDSLTIGERLTLLRDPFNKYDRNAIAINDYRKNAIGWIPRELAEILAPEIDAGINYYVVIEKIINNIDNSKNILVKLFYC